MVGNTPSTDAFLWSALSLITLLAGTAIVLFSFGKFDFLGWKGLGEHIHPQLLPGNATESQRATIKYFVVVALLFLAQVLLGGATAHYRAEPGSHQALNPRCSDEGSTSNWAGRVVVTRGRPFP